MKQLDRFETTRRVGILGIVGNIFLLIIKIIVGIFLPIFLVYLILVYFLQNIIDLKLTLALIMKSDSAIKR